MAVREVLAYQNQRYNTRQQQIEVQANGYAGGCRRICRELHAHGLREQQPHSIVPHTTDFDPTGRAAPKRLLGQPAPTTPNRV